MGDQSYSIRVGLDGTAEVKRPLDDIGASGSAAFDRIAQSADKASTATDRAEQRLRRLAASAQAAARADTHQLAWNTGFAPGLAGEGAGSARASAEVFEAQIRAEEQLAQRTRALKAEIDPLWAAQQKLSGATKTADELFKAGTISAAEHAAAIKLARAEYGAAEAAAKHLAGGLGLSTLQMNVLMGAAHHAADALVAGANPMRVLSMEAVKAAPAMGGLGGLATAAGRAIFSAGGFAVAGAAALALAAKAGLDYEASFQKLAAAADGYGRRWNTSASALEAAAQRGAQAAHISVSAARDLEAQFLRTGTIGSSTFTGLIGVSRNFSIAMGESSKAAGETLTKAFADPAKGAEELNAALGFLDDKALRHIEILAEQNDKTAAQKELLDQLSKSVATATDHVDSLAKAWQGVASAASDAWTNIGKAVASGYARVTGSETPEQKLAGYQATLGSLDLTTQAGREEKADLDRKIAAIQKQLSDESNGARQRQDATAAGNAAWADTGEAQRDTLQMRLNALQAGAKAGAGAFTPERWAALQLDISRTSEALKSWLPQEQKRLQLEELDAKLARERDPATRGRLAQQKALIASSGEMLTAEERQRDAALKGEEAEGRADRRFDRRAENLGREVASMRVSADEALKVAAAYLQSASAGEVAEAKRKALTDATRKGADADAFAAAQLAQNVGEAAANGAKTTAQLRDETAARRAANDQILAGSLDAGDLNEALKTEAAIRPLVAAAAHAEGTAKATLLQVIKDLRAEEKDGAAEANRSAILEATDRAGDQVELLQHELTLVTATNRAREVSIAQFKALQELKQRHVDPTSAEGRGLVAGRVAEANAGADLSQAQWAFNTTREQQNQLDTLRAEAASLGETDAARQAILTKLRVEQELKKQGIELTSQEGQAILANAQRIDQESRAYDLQKAKIDELQGAANSVVDTLGNALSPDHWRHFGDVGKEILGDLEKEFVKLALLNPLKNAISGNHTLPTFSLFGGGGGAGAIAPTPAGDGGGGGITSWLSSFFHVGGASPGGGIGSWVASLFNFHADGTQSAPGGWSIVGERGPELLNLTPGAQVVPHDRTVDLLRQRAQAGGGFVTAQPIHFDLRGAVVTQDLIDSMHDIARSHARQAANGALKTAQRNTASWHARAAQEKG